jgi:ribonuclease R
MPKKNKGPQPVNEQTLLSLFKQASHPLKKRDVMDLLGADKKAKKLIWALLDDLVDDGTLIRIGRAYGLVDQMPLVKGVFEVQRAGIAFVLPEDKQKKDILIRPENFGDAWHGDTVLAAVLPDRRGKNPIGRVARVVKRKLSELPVRAGKPLGQDLILCHPTDPRHKFVITADTRSVTPIPQKNDILMVRPEEFLEEGMWSATVLEVMGQEMDLSVQEALVKTNHQVPGEFPNRVVREAEALPEDPGPEQFADRTDLRHVPFVTIDGAKARDFDDAVHVAPHGDGYVLSVAIADVSHYVAPGTAMDQEAVERSNSYYFPLSVEPMFPEKLSNGLCSLKPDVPRLAMVARIFFDKHGEPGKTEFEPAVIKSHARLTYTEVNDALVDKKQDIRNRLGDLTSMLEECEALALLLLAQRQKRGTLDFDLPEPVIHLSMHDQSLELHPKVRLFSHRLIEEFMIAANEAVARFLAEKEIPFLYRIHPEPNPEKLEKLFQLLATTNLAQKLPPYRDHRGLQRLADLAHGTDLEFLVSRMLLRTMMQAKYSPANEGHYGLASEHYCHFTSPIRRYADLQVHRAMKVALGLDKSSQTPTAGQLERIADTLNTNERRAMDAEREILKRAVILFLKDKVGQTFTGIISSLADFGFWVELEDVMAEGMVRLSTLHDDYYGFIPERQQLLGSRTGRVFSLGQQVKVRLAGVNLSLLEVNLEVVRQDEEKGGAKKGKKKEAKKGGRRRRR